MQVGVSNVGSLQQYVTECWQADTRLGRAGISMDDMDPYHAVVSLMHVQAKSSVYTVSTDKRGAPTLGQYSVYATRYLALE